MSQVRRAAVVLTAAILFAGCASGSKGGPNPDEALYDAKPTSTVAADGTTKPSPHASTAPTTVAASTTPRVTQPAGGSCHFDPHRPVRLDGVAGVTCAQQTWAESLVVRTLAKLPRWADYKVAEAAGFQTTNDAWTGYEHFVNWNWIGDGDIYDPDHPQSLVYVGQQDGSKKLVAVMFMLPRTGPIEQAYKPGGNLMQFHEHSNLCYTRRPDGSLILVGEDDAQGNCPAGSSKPGDPAPMVHVWIQKNPCGPFASIPGHQGGQVPKGEQRLCLPQFADVP